MAADLVRRGFADVFITARIAGLDAICRHFLRDIPRGESEAAGDLVGVAVDERDGDFARVNVSFRLSGDRPVCGEALDNWAFPGFYEDYRSEFFRPIGVPFIREVCRRYLRYTGISVELA